MDIELEGCDICGEAHPTEECPIFFQDGEDHSGLSRARLTLPANITLVENADISPTVIAREFIPAKTKLGPFEAKKVTQGISIENVFLLKVFCKGKEAIMLDTSDEFQCNWMCFIPTARNTGEMNCIAVQIGSDIYYITLSEIQPGTELRVWYAPHYAKKMSKSSEPDGLTATMYELAFGSSEISFDTADFDLSISPYKQAGHVDMSFSLIKTESILGVAERVEPDHNKTLPEIKTELKFDDEVKSGGDSVEDNLPEPKATMKASKVTSAVNTRHVEINDDDEHAIPEATQKVLKQLSHPRQIHATHAMNTSGPCECRRCGVQCEDVYALAAHVKKHLQEETELQKHERRERQLKMRQVLEKERLAKKRKLAEISNRDTGSTEKRLKSSNGDEHGKNIAPALTKRVRKVDPLVKAFLTKSKHKKDPSKFEKATRKFDELKVLKKREKSVGLSYRFTTKYKVEPSVDELVSQTDIAETDSKDIHDETDENTPENTEGSRDNTTTNNTHKLAFMCNVCDRLFEKRQYLEKHLDGHNAVYQCDVCDRKFLHLSQFQSHKCVTDAAEVMDSGNDTAEQEGDSDGISIKKEEKEMFYCEFCGKAFKSKQYLLTHMANHTGEYHCEKCGVHYARRESWIQHVAKCNPEALVKGGYKDVYQCSQCSKVFTREIAFINHEKVHLKAYECERCKKSFASSFSLTRHGCTGPPPERYECKECGRTFKRKVFLDRHKPIHTGEFTCVVCSKRFERKEALMKHMLECTANVQVKTTGEIKCTVCNMQFIDAKVYQSHYEEHTHPFGCDKCKSRFMRRINLDKHKCKEDYGGQSFECDVCKKTFKNPEYLEKHMAVHKANQFHCDRCDKVFRRIQMWKTHMCLDDEGNKALIHRRKNGQDIKMTKVSTICTICGKSYHNVSNLTKHMKRHFEKTVKCDECGMMFHEPAGLKCHKDNIHGSAEPQFACEFCGKKMKCKNSLYSHRKTFHQETSIIYQCSECYRQFKSKSYLLRHVESHKNTKILFCDECPKNYKTEEQLQKHQDWHANGDRFECDLCIGMFETESELKRHCRRDHAGILFCCKYCNNSCSQKEAMRRHLHKCHPTEVEWQHNTDEYIMSLTMFIKEYAEKQMKEDSKSRTGDGSIEVYPSLGVLESTDNIADKHAGKMIIAEVQVPGEMGSTDKQTILIQTTDDALSAQTDLSQQVLEALQQLTHANSDALQENAQPTHQYITVDEDGNSAQQIPVTLPAGLTAIADGYYILPAGFEESAEALLAVKSEEQSGGIDGVTSGHTAEGSGQDLVNLGDIIQ